MKEQRSIAHQRLGILLEMMKPVSVCFSRRRRSRLGTPKRCARAIFRGMERDMGWCGRVLGQIRALLLMAVVSGSWTGCSHAQVRALPGAAGRASVEPTAAAPPPPLAGPPGLAEYCAARDEGRAAFRLNLKFEVRAASLLPREGYEPRTLAPDELAAVGQPKIFL